MPQTEDQEQFDNRLLFWAKSHQDVCQACIAQLSGISRFSLTPETVVLQKDFWDDPRKECRLAEVIDKIKYELRLELVRRDLPIASRNFGKPRTWCASTFSLGPCGLKVRDRRLSFPNLGEFTPFVLSSTV